MNWKHNLNCRFFLVLFGLIIIVIVFIFFNTSKNQKNIESAIKESKDLRELKYEKLSPDGLNKIILYYLAFDNSLYRDYYRDYFDNNMIVSVMDMEDGRENYLFTGGRISEPKWLGNKHIFFTSYCGSSCQGIYLINVFNKETRLGVLSYITQGDNKPVYTHFKDWFGHEFKFNGWVDEIRSDTLGDKIYLIFYMRDDKRKSIEPKRFLFTGNGLEEQNNI